MISNSARSADREAPAARSQLETNQQERSVESRLPLLKKLLHVRFSVLETENPSSNRQGGYQPFGDRLDDPMMAGLAVRQVAHEG